FFTAFASLTLLGVFAAGWSSNNKYALLSALRMVAMAASYEVPMILSLLIPALLAGSFQLTTVVEAQRGLWFVGYPVIGQAAVRWSSSPMRLDQAIRITWMFLLPAALLNLLIAAAWVVRR